MPEAWEGESSWIKGASSLLETVQQEKEDTPQVNVQNLDSEDGEVHGPKAPAL